MDTYAILEAAWKDNASRMSQSKAFALLASGRMTPRQYAAVLRQVFHHARENPQIQALATARFRGDQRALVRNFYRHAISEIGHDELALRDIEALGEDVSRIRSERPLPATFALLASAFHMIEHHEPVAYLGYLFHLEYTPVQLGHLYMEALERAGIPRTAMGFLEEHATADVAHVKLIRTYLDKLVTTPEELDAVLYMQRVTAELYARMLDQAIETADQWDGLSRPSPEETRRGFTEEPRRSRPEHVGADA